MNTSIPKINEQNPELAHLIELRKTFHSYPELGFSEFNTSCIICDYLSKLGFELKFGKDLYKNAYPDIDHISDLVVIDKSRIDGGYESAAQKMKPNPWLESMQGGFTGVIASMKCSDHGPQVGFRFDIDALPVKESSDNSHLPCAHGFASQNANMHACGHDGHTTIGLGLANRIQQNRQQLKGTYHLIFQPSEEGPSGGHLFAKFPIFKKLDYLIPIHLGIIGQRQVVCRLSFLAARWFNVVYEGLNAHAAACPENGRNALLAACQAVNSLLAISRHSAGLSRVNAGKFFSDNPSNVISSHAEFNFELRGQTNTVCDYLNQRATAIIEHTARMHGLSYRLKQISECIYAENSTELTPLLKNAIIRAGIDPSAIIDDYLVPGSEDATFLMDQVRQNGGKTSFLCIGSPTSGGHHNPKFDFDQDLLLWSVAILWEFIKEVNAQPDSQ